MTHRKPDGVLLLIIAACCVCLHVITFSIVVFKHIPKRCFINLVVIEHHGRASCEGREPISRISTYQVLVVAISFGKDLLKNRHPKRAVLRYFGEDGGKLSFTVFFERQVVIDDESHWMTQHVQVDSVQAGRSKIPLRVQESLMDRQRVFSDRCECCTQPAVANRTLSNVVHGNSSFTEESFILKDFSSSLPCDFVRNICQAALSFTLVFPVEDLVAVFKVFLTL